jgi:hypothetical protein
VATDPSLGNVTDCDAVDSKSESQAQGWTQFAQPTARSAHRYHQVDHLRLCGNRAILEALLAVEGGESIDSVLTDFSRLPPELYQQTLKHHAAYQIGGVA